MDNKEISFIQQYIWLDQKLSINSPKYNTGGYVIIDGDVDFQIFNKSLQHFFNQNEIFLYMFQEKWGVLQKEMSLDVCLENIEYFELENIEKGLSCIKDDFLIPFKINEEKKLFKIWLIKIGMSRYIWYAKFHHILADGYCFQLLFKEVGNIYSDFVKKSVFSKNPIKHPPYSAFIAVDQKYSHSKAFIRDRQYWLNKYGRLPNLIYPNKNGSSDNYNFEFKINQLENQNLKAFVDKEKINVFNLLIAAFSLVISKYYFTEEVNFGIPVLNRQNKLHKNIFGPTTNLFPLQIKLDLASSFKELIKLSKRELFSSYRHHRFHLARILKELPQKPSRLYDFRLSYEDFRYETNFADFKSIVIPLTADSEDDPISIHAMEKGDGSLNFRFDINENYVDRFDALQIAESLKYVLQTIDEIKDLEISKINICNRLQHQRVVELSEGVKIDRPKLTFLDQWNTISTTHESEIAVIDNEISYTYGEINSEVERLAQCLIGLNVEKGDRLGVMMVSSRASIIAILASFKVGATYIPIDVNYPLKRKEDIFDDCNPKLVLVDTDKNQGKETFINITKSSIYRTQNIKKRFPKLSPSDTAYIIYTSGTSGKPKGVPITHYSLFDYTETFSTFFELNKKDRVLQQSSLSFDASVEEIFPILSKGGVLVISNNHKDMNQLFIECARYKITLLSTNPYAIQFLNEHFKSYDLVFRILISGGDILKINHISNLINVFNIYNTYGPTESTVCATYHKVKNLNENIPIGKPISNRVVCVMNGNDLIPQGATGEIFLSGSGISAGYFNNDEQTRKSFTNQRGQRFYRTGDLGRWNKNGELEFHGRKDNQLNLRGYRIEAKEIELAISQIQEDISFCYVSVERIDELPVLVAYLVLHKKNSFNAKTLKAKLGHILPDHMIPSHIVAMDNIPLSPNGKIDKNALPNPNMQTDSREIHYANTESQKRVMSIWEDLLKVTNIDIDMSFFELGGHSLLANQFIGVLRDKMNIEITLDEFYKDPTIRSLATYLKRPKSITTSIGPAPQMEYYPLSFSQERLWFLNELNRENHAYIVPRAIRLKGQLDFKLIENTFSFLIRKHEILRTIFPIIEGVPYQKVLPKIDFTINKIDFKKQSLKEKKEALQQFILKEGNTGFNPSVGPLLRVTIISFSKRENILVLCEHHLIHDGWTQGVLLKEFINTYSILKTIPNFQEEIPSIQFKDYAFWERNYLNPSRLENHLNYWEKHLKNNKSVLALPIDYKRPEQISGKGDLIVKNLSKNLSRRLRKFSIQNDSTLFITMLTAFKILLYRFSSEIDISIGSGVANRHIGEIDNMLGMVINTIVFRTKLKETDTILDTLKKVRKNCLECYTYEDTPFGKVVEKLNPKRELGLMPLFQYFFSFMNTPSRNLELPDLDLEILNSYNHSSKFDINIVVVTPLEQALQEGIATNHEEISIEWEYNTDIFSKKTMQNMIDSYSKILDSMVDNPQQTISSIQLLRASLTQSFLDRFRGDTIPLPNQKTILDLFLDQVTIRKDSVAVVFENMTLTYSELNQFSNQVANFLIEQKKVKVGDSISVKLNRSQWLIIALLGILKTGSAYIPIDPNYPEYRIKSILKDSNSKVMIDDQFLENMINANPSIIPPSVQINQKSIAYIIYTSGTTGSPKGVMNSHAGLMNRLLWAQKYFKLEEGSDVVLQKTPYSFDVSVWEFFWPLIVGVKLVIARPDGHRDSQYLKELIIKEKITTLHFVPSMLESFIISQEDNNPITCVKRVLCSGEALQIHQIASFKNCFGKSAEIYNLYGPTEAAIDVTCWKVPLHKINKLEHIPLGSPIDNTEIYILDKKQNLCGIGVVGEIYIGGIQVALGYLNNEKMTNEWFLKNPFRPETEYKMYRTGDIGRWRADGTVEFLGRKDHQIKLRGFRIELGEIEQVLLGQTNLIKQAIVDVKEYKGNQRLVAYIVCKNSSLDKSKLRSEIKKKLPEHMIPSHYIELEKLPTTPNGKLDRKALPEITEKDIVRHNYSPPKSFTEEKLVAIWKEILEIEKVGSKDNFFELGGNSLQITRLTSAYHKHFNAKIKIKDLYQFQTLDSHAELIEINDWLNQESEVKGSVKKTISF
ncbi:amino acid adenylation domain-containing protein [Yeosuana marina]|uniref:amino acid adenylation domain-containing protein n=1 Tax=Yeosuana marina TaxID=1565536 RepID=UPI0030C84A62